MTLRAKGIAVLLVQLAIVLSIAAKYAWERHSCPRVWTRTGQLDPQQPIRGRYLALTLHASACGLPLGKGDETFGWNGRGQWAGTPAQKWTVLPAARNGKLAPVIADEMKPGQTQELTLMPGQPCDFARLSEPVEFFIPENAKQPFSLAPGEELWAEVTVPPSGPPRPIQLAISDGKNFRILDLR